ncbi:protein of unknown function [Burkholderia multivorans]
MVPWCISFVGKSWENSAAPPHVYVDPCYLIATRRKVAAAQGQLRYPRRPRRGVQEARPKN